MKLYNPFKPHIVAFKNGKFGVRRMQTGLLLGEWQYLDKENQYWFWTQSCIHDYCKMTAEEATEIMRDPYRTDKLLSEEMEEMEDKGTHVGAREIRLGYTLLCILAYGAWTAIAVCIAWPIINWMANGFGG